MRILFDIVSKMLSMLFYPLFIPTYGMALFCYAATTQADTPPQLAWMVLAVSGTLLFTCVLPIIAISMLIRRGKVSDIQIVNAQERTWPYIYATMGFACWAYLMLYILEAPLFIGLVSVGATIALLIVTMVNRWWKISAHLTGFGGFFGGLMSYYLGIGETPSWFILGLCLVGSLVLMYARLNQKAHTPAQVCAGWLVGMACSFLPYYIVHYGA